jgi:hypothetical protein
VKNDLNGGIGQHLAQPVETTDRQRIHNRRLTAGGELKQVDTVVEAVKAGGFGIDGEEWLSAESIEEPLQLSLVLYQTYTRV